jgi:hypothetical protein
VDDLEALLAHYDEHGSEESREDAANPSVREFSCSEHPR